MIVFLKKHNFIRKLGNDRLTYSTGYSANYPLQILRGSQKALSFIEKHRIVGFVRGCMQQLRSEEKIFYLTFVEGEIVDIQQEKYLAYTTIDPNSDIDNVSDNYLTVTYDLLEQGEKTILEVTQGDYSKVADGARKYEEAWNNGEGWNPILIEIKKLVE